MEVSISQSVMIWTIINFILLLGILSLGTYTIVLIIKALRKYIKKN